MTKWFFVLGVLIMANVLDSDTRIVGNLEMGAGGATVPPSLSGGSGAMTTTGRVNGSIHMRADTNELSEILHNTAVEKIGLGQHAIEARLVTPLVANSANVYRTFCPRKLKVTGISRAYDTVPASVLGTVLVSVLGGTSAPIELLASSAENEEGLSNFILTVHNLTGTPSVLLLDKGDEIEITITSNNADMTGGAVGQYHIYYEDN